ncbi:flagellar protein FlaG protein [Geobacter metallireducens RCH3]|uniref:Flagellar protein FlaG n=1 Tax=Geobacter metallireducens (strain ATCC 53774 / DSM 7210 / GS-15) TaxID=269799 RepID=Q39YG8_GEOMG|nr:flagellar protein FlaG [Geobacter metallireducens]ABB30706.1 flagellar protein FlaG [Geobacter metallireducens GS-15]EHP85513.1 flagellar protein FlaG protein [Geobacter metallireducens RCH3]
MNVEFSNVARVVPGGATVAEPLKPSQAEERNKEVPVELPKTALKELLPAEQEERAKAAADRINEFIESFTRDLKFTIDKDSERVVLKVVDRKSGDVIRQIPSEEALKIAKALDELKGLIIREQV